MRRVDIFFYVIERWDQEARIDLTLHSYAKSSMSHTGFFYHITHKFHFIRIESHQWISQLCYWVNKYLYSILHLHCESSLNIKGHQYKSNLRWESQMINKCKSQMFHFDLFISKHHIFFTISISSSLCTNMISPISLAWSSCIFYFFNWSHLTCQSKSARVIPWKPLSHQTGV